jgi:hypothetical protein
MQSLQILPFDCDRTCPQAGEKLCRFSRIFKLLGTYKVNSHTVTVQVDFKDLDMLQKALKAIGGIWKGWGKHKLFDIEKLGRGDAEPIKLVEGYGFRLPGWTYDCVLSKSGELSYDNYDGRWGDQAELDKLKVGYTVEVCQRAATLYGWQSERVNGELKIYHPAGGVMTVAADGTIDAQGFVGHGCHEAIQSLGLPILEAQIKPEYSQVAAEVQISR